MAITKEMKALERDEISPDSCPKCGYSELEYGGYEDYESGMYYQVKCPKCGFEGQQHYNLTFACFTDNDGKDVYAD